MTIFTCQIEYKSYVIERKSHFYEIVERGKGVTHRATFSTNLISCLFSEIKSIHVNSVKLGHLKKIRDNEVTAYLSVRCNVNGRFLAIMLVSKQYAKGFSTVCVPFGSKGEGLKVFAAFLDKILPQKQVIHDHHGPTVEVSNPFFLSDMDHLKAKCLVATLSSDSYAWNLLPGDLMDMFDFLVEPDIKPLGGNSFLLNFDSSEDLEQVMKAKEFSLWDCNVSVSYWRPAIDTNDDNNLYRHEVGYFVRTSSTPSSQRLHVNIPEINTSQTSSKIAFGKKKLSWNEMMTCQ